MNQSFADQIKAARSANTPLLAIETADNNAAIQRIAAALSDKTPLIVISESKGNNLTVYGNTADKSPTGSSIGWNSDKTEGGADASGNKERPAFVGLAHELGHGVAAGAGKQPLPKNDGPNKTPGTTPPSEKPAVNAENSVRKEHNIPERAGYYEK